MAKYLADYTVLDADYQNGAHQVIIGNDAGTTGDFASIQDPANTGINTLPPIVDPAPPHGPLSKDPVVFSYTLAPNNTARVLMGKIITDFFETDPLPSACYYTAVIPAATVGVPWATPSTTMGADIVLQYPSGTAQATNPHGVAQAGDFLYIIDYNSQNITILGKTELDAQANNTAKVLAQAPFDVGDEVPLDSDAKGQAIIALTNAGTTYLFALYIRNDATGQNYSPSVLVKLSVNTSTGALTYVDRVQLGLNAVEIIPVLTATDPDEIQLLIPEIGGSQNAGSTNASASDIWSVPAFVSWASPFAPTKLLTGDSASYDIRAIAAPRPGSGSDTVYILTSIYTSDYNGTNWRLYQTSIPRLIAAGGITLSAASSGDTPILTVADSDTSADGSKGYYWDILYENGGTGNVDRLWFLRGSPILITLVSTYSTTDGKNFAVGTGTGTIGGQNINSVDLIAETLSQAAAGVSLKRSMGGGTAVTASAASTEEEEA